MCEKFCICSSECKNRWAGCTCKRSRCKTGACPCFAAGRECDPDLCHGCGACLHPDNIAQNAERRCQNVPLQTGIHRHLWLAPSGVHGWGGFVKEPLDKNEFIHEYVGETISQQEAERRGRVYDVQRLSFLFNLSDLTVVDATRKGNKTKFINHASSNASKNNLQANVEVRYVLARGERHVCLYAQRDIAANEEVRPTGRVLIMLRFPL
jgi:histone-lysine N-methyltransferase EZH2